jgi:hypothetical protein
MNKKFSSGIIQKKAQKCSGIDLNVCNLFAPKAKARVSAEIFVGD